MTRTLSTAVLTLAMLGITGGLTTAAQAAECYTVNDRGACLVTSEEGVTLLGPGEVRTPEVCAGAQGCMPESTVATTPPVVADVPTAVCVHWGATLNECVPVR